MLTGFTFDICIAVSSSAAEPEPLSLMPGPDSTLSRCAPAMTTLSLFLPVFSAITLLMMRVSLGLTSTCAVEPGAASFSPSAYDAPTTGMSISASPRVPTISSVRSGSVD